MTHKAQEGEAAQQQYCRVDFIVGSQFIYEAEEEAKDKKWYEHNGCHAKQPRLGMVFVYHQGYKEQPDTAVSIE